MDIKFLTSKAKNIVSLLSISNPEPKKNHCEKI